MNNPFSRVFTWSVKNERDERFEGSSTGLIFPFYGVPVYVPAGTARELRRCKKLIKRTAQLSERLSDALLELQELEEFNNGKFVSKAAEKVPPSKTAPNA